MKLAEYLDQNEISRHEFAARIGVSPETVRTWLVGTKEGQPMPQGKHLAAVIRETGGAVTANDFLPAIVESAA